MLTRRFTAIVMMIVASWAGSVVGQLTKAWPRSSLTYSYFLDS
jgi:hypothetical protein